MFFDNNTFVTFVTFSYKIHVLLLLLTIIKKVTIVTIVLPNKKQQILLIFMNFPYLPKTFNRKIYKLHKPYNLIMRTTIAISENTKTNLIYLKSQLEPFLKKTMSFDEVLLFSTGFLIKKLEEIEFEEEFKRWVGERVKDGSKK